MDFRPGTLWPHAGSEIIMSYNCRKCASPKITRAFQWGLLERLLSVVAIPFQCLDCRNRFYVFSGLRTIQWEHGIGAGRRVAMASVDHVSEDSLERYCLRTLPKRETGPLEDHLSVCHKCQDRHCATAEFVSAMRKAAERMRRHKPQQLSN